MALFPKWLTSDLWSAIKTKDDAIRDFINNELGAGHQSAKLVKSSASDFDFTWQSDQVLYKSFDIGSWNMNTTATKAVFVANAFGIDFPITKIVSINVTIYGDTDDFAYPLNYTNPGNANTEGGVVSIQGTGTNFKDVTFNLMRVTGGQFQSNFFDDAARNRGRIVVGYLNVNHI